MRRALISFALLLTTTVAFAARPTDNREPTTGSAPRSGAHFVMEPKRVLTQADIADLAARGIEVQSVLPGPRYLVRAADAAEVAADPRVRRVEHFGAAHKISPVAGRIASRGIAFMTARVRFHDDVRFDEAQRAIENAGGTVERPLQTSFDPAHALTVRIPTTAVTRLAQDERVFGVYGPPRRIKEENAVAAQLSHVTPLFSAPYNLSGAGVVLSEFELAPADTTHPEFSGRFTSHLTGNTTGSDSQHPTHVAGTMIAQGLDPRAKGMAPAAQLHEFSANDDIGVVLNNKQNTLSGLGVVADNNSWGYVLGWCNAAECGAQFEVWSGASELFGGYDALDSSPYDAMTRKTSVLFVHSAGNDGSEGQNPVSPPWFQHQHTDNNGNTVKNEIFCYSQNGTGTDCPTGICTAGNSTVTGEPHCEKPSTDPANPIPHPTYGPFGTIGLISAVKNVIAVGAITPTLNIAGFSSRGPTLDGRVKPDLVAKGTQQFSTLPNGGYGILQGTSMSSPVVTGISALVVEQWRRTFGGQTPASDQIKTLLIAGADDLGNPGPDYTYGFGLVNAQNSVDLIIADNNTGSRIRTASVGQAQQIDTPMVVGTTQNLRVVLGWTDPETLPQPDQVDEKTLVNDLDLKVVDPGGNTVLPYVLDKNNPTANATQGANHVDNTEEVEIKNAAAGTYHVIVTGTTVPVASPQRYVLVANAPLAIAPPPCTDMNEPNDTPAAATNLPSGVAVLGRLCSASDIDVFSFTGNGPGTVTVSTTDTAVKVTIIQTGQTVTVAAGSSATLQSTAGTAAVEIVPAGAIGSSASYTIVATYPFTAPPRRRVAR